MKTPKILVAQDPHATAITEEALQEFDLVVVSTFQAAESEILGNSIDLFILGVHFDESRAIDLVSHIRANSNHHDTPIIIVRFLPTTLGNSLRVTINALIKVGTINDYLEVEGDPDADSIIRKAVLKALPAPNVIT